MPQLYTLKTNYRKLKYKIGVGRDLAAGFLGAVEIEPTEQHKESSRSQSVINYYYIYVLMLVILSNCLWECFSLGESRSIV